MLLKIFALTALWLIGLAVWIYFSTFVHELAHLIVSWLVGFKIKGFRLISVPFGPKGYVDVLIPGGTKYYYLKRGLMHLAGLAAHLKLMGIAIISAGYTAGLAARGLLWIGAAVNIYLFVLNAFPPYSDGRQFFDLMRRWRSE